ncbi:MAG TPA: hypothetical protein PLV83_00630 [Bacilli bacterium]|nr:hypothetical protein [Bacilli bacterium]
MGEQEVKKMPYFEYIVTELSNNSTASLELLYSIKDKLNKIKPMGETKSTLTDNDPNPVNCVADYFVDERDRQEKIRTILIEINSYLNELV